MEYGVFGVNFFFFYREVFFEVLKLFVLSQYKNCFIMCRALLYCIVGSLSASAHGALCKNRRRQS